MKYYLNLTLIEAKVNKISGPVELIEDSWRVVYILVNGTEFCTHDALYSPKSRKNLLRFKDIHRNGFHIEIINENNAKYLYITSNVSGKKCILEKLSVLSYGLYYMTIKLIASYVIIKQKLCDIKAFMFWYNRLGHPGSIMTHRIIKNFHGHQLKNLKYLLSNENTYIAYSQGKLMGRRSHSRISFESPSF